jgi:hypothetical protein
MTDFNWIKGGFDTAMMLDFTIRNDNDYTVAFANGFRISVWVY